jgi:hypothetical protein
MNKTVSKLRCYSGLTTGYGISTQASYRRLGLRRSSPSECRCHQRSKMQRLMLGAHLVWCDARHNGLHAFTLPGSNKTCAISGVRHPAVSMTDRPSQMLDIRLKTRRHALCGPQVHDLPARNESGAPAYHNSHVCDTVRLDQS